jgi:putative molybdopterin biosynthesis protein
VPIAREPYDLVLWRSTVEEPLLEPLWELLAAPAFREAVEGLGGYDTAEMGLRIR